MKLVKTVKTIHIDKNLHHKFFNEKITGTIHIPNKVAI